MTVIRKVYDVSDTVICDVCNTDHSHSGAVGGWQFGGHGYCPGCATPDAEARIAGYSESHLITARAHPGETFRDFIMRVRGPDNQAVIVTAPEGDVMHEVVAGMFRRG